MSLTTLSLGRNTDVIFKLFPPRESLVNDIPAGDGNIEKLFYSVLKVGGQETWKNIQGRWRETWNSIQSRWTVDTGQENPEK
jgi:hypothetical protein